MKFKTDREFLDGIYKKAEGLSQEDFSDPFQKKHEIRFFTPIKTVIVAAAAFMLVMLPSIYFSQVSEKMEIPQGYTLLQPVEPKAEPRFYSEVPMTHAVLSPFEDAELVCTAKVSKIEKSVYDAEQNQIKTTVIVKPTETVKGIEIKKIAVTVNGGIDKKAKTYQDYEAVFEKGEDVLIYLIPSFEDDNAYILSGGTDGKYTYHDGEEDNKEYMNASGDIVTVSSLKEQIVQ